MIGIPVITRGMLRRFVPVEHCEPCGQDMPIDHTHQSEAAPDATGAAPDPQKGNHRV